MNNQVAYFESSIRIFDHMDLITREVFMPLLCADNLSLSVGSNNQQQQLQTTDQADKLMDVMHRIIAQLAVAQSQVEEIVLVATLKVPVATCGDKVGQRCFKVLPTDFEK